MTQKRKAELQRKLSMAPVAKPPSDLADRIKATIPDYLDARQDRERLSRSIAFSLRVAASIILVVASAFIAVEFLSRSDMGPVPQAPPETKSVAVTAAPPVAIPEPQPVAQIAEAASRHVDAPKEERRGRREEGKLAAVAEAPAPPPAAPLPAPPPPPAATIQQADMAEAVADEVQMTAARAQAPAAAPSRTLATSNFQTRKDPAAENEVDRLKKLLRDGETPAGVNVEAVVDHFAGPPQPDLRDVHLEVEASRAPLSGDDAAVIRYTIDVPARREGRGRFQRAKLSIALETAVIDSYRTISGVQPPSDASKLLESGTSVTGLVEVRLVKGTSPDQRVATILLHHGNTRAAEPIFARDLDRRWQSASRRHRLATLSARWSESLSGTNAAGVAEAAAELAEEAPGDERAQELATLTASSRRRTSSPTGSGR